MSRLTSPEYLLNQSWRLAVVSTVATQCEVKRPIPRLTYPPFTLQLQSLRKEKRASSPRNTATDQRDYTGLVGVLVGRTGFVGSHLARAYEFEQQVHRADITSILGLSTDLLVCAGLPAQKWRANRDFTTDWSNMAGLAQVLTTVQAKCAVLISTIDVYQPAVDVDETSAPRLDGGEAYGTHRAWFEAFFQARFPHALVLRLPALFAADVRKNLVHDLLHDRADQLAGMNPASTFQWFDVSQTWAVIKRAWDEGITLLNVSSEPVTAQDVADLFCVELMAQTPPVAYDMRSIHAEDLGGHDGYLFTSTTVLNGIASLRGDAP